MGSLRNLKKQEDPTPKSQPERPKQDELPKDVKPGVYYHEIDISEYVAVLMDDELEYLSSPEGVCGGFTQRLKTERTEENKGETCSHPH